MPEIWACSYHPGAYQETDGTHPWGKWEGFNEELCKDKGKAKKDGEKIHGTNKVADAIIQNLWVYAKNVATRRLL